MKIKDALASKKFRNQRVVLAVALVLGLLAGVAPSQASASPSATLPAADHSPVLVATGHVGVIPAYRASETRRPLLVSSHRTTTKYHHHHRRPLLAQWWGRVY